MWTVFLQLAFRQFVLLGPNDQALQPGFFEVRQSWCCIQHTSPLHEAASRWQLTLSLLSCSCRRATIWTALKRATCWRNGLRRC